MGSKHAAALILSALQCGSPRDIRATLANLHSFIPPESTASECERKDLLEGLGAEAIAHPFPGRACRALLEHLAGTDQPPLRIQ